MGPHRVRIRAGWVMLPLVVWLIAACSMRWQTPLNPTLSEPLHVSRVPLTIGLYYGPELRTYELVRVRGKARIVVPIGPATVPLLDRVTPRLFEAVVPVDGLPPQVKADARLAAILEPRLEEADAQFSMFMGTDYRSELTYRFTLYSLDGTPFASWTVTGSGEHSSWGDRPTAIGRATDPRRSAGRPTSRCRTQCVRLRAGSGRCPRCGAGSGGPASRWRTETVHASLGGR